MWKIFNGTHEFLWNFSGRHESLKISYIDMSLVYICETQPKPPWPYHPQMALPNHNHPLYASPATTTSLYASLATTTLPLSQIATPTKTTSTNRYTHHNHSIVPLRPPQPLNRPSPATPPIGEEVWAWSWWILVEFHTYTLNSCLYVGFLNSHVYHWDFAKIRVYH